MYVSVMKSTRLAFGKCLKTDSASSSKVSGITVKLCRMALSSMILTASDGRSIDGSMWDSKLWRRFDFSVFVGTPSALAKDHGIGPKGNDISQLEVNILFNGKKNKLTEDVLFNSFLDDFVLRTGQFLLDLKGCKRFSACYV